MTAQSPLVSVVCCVYNAGEFLRPAIESILGQTYSNFELIVVDDGSSDGAAEALKTQILDPRVRWHRQPNAGKPVAMNFALGQAQGEYYVSQDADDLSHPRRLEVLVRALQDHPDVAGAFSGHELILDGKRVAPITRAKGSAECRADIGRMAMPGHDPTAMYRRSMVRDFHYDPALPVVEGYDYILRVGERFPMLVVGECLYSYRIHRGSITHADPERRERLVHEVIRRACERRGKPFEEWLGSKKEKRQSEADHADNGVAAHFIISVQDQRRGRQFVPAIRCGLKCLSLSPFDPHYYKALVYAVTPVPLHRYLKSGG